MPAPELELFHELDAAPDRGRQMRFGIVSGVAHAVVLAVLMSIDFELATPPPRNFPEVTMRRVTPLVAPPPQVLRELTQKAPNTKEVAKELDLAGLTPRPEVKAPPARAALTPRPTPSPAPTPALPSAPKIDPTPAPVTPEAPPPGLGDTKLPPPPAPEPPPEKPKIAFESIAGSGMSRGNTQGTRAPNVQLTVPKGTVDEAVSSAIRSRSSGGLVVGDNLEPGGLGQSLSRTPAPGKMGSALELLSDPKGADFRPYLMRVLSAVRLNWFAVIPESARLGQRRGRVVIQFSIDRNGAVPKLVIATPSGAEPLDRAAVAGISASNPFPPLPAEFQGDQIRVQLSFVYNGDR